MKKGPVRPFFYFISEILEDKILSDFDKISDSGNEYNPEVKEYCKA